ncbi:MAG: hypothetical protein Q4E67_02990, partial [Planctomycetia bacterium]|nr:hypothetical protein [Planctomycetia bacterium]
MKHKGKNSYEPGWKNFRGTHIHFESGFNVTDPDGLHDAYELASHCRQRGFPKGLKQQLAAANVENEELRVLNDDLKDQLDTELENKRKAITGLENELKVQKEELEKLQKEVDDSRDKIRTSIASVSAAQEQANQLSKENTTIREQIAQLILERDKEVKKNVELTDQLNEVNREIADLQKRSEAMTQELGQA